MSLFIENALSKIFCKGNLNIMFKLSISNLAWNPENDNEIFALMQEYGFSGLEIAPTKIFPENPYSKLEEAKIWTENLKKEYGFSVPSMQSIWYGKNEKLFGSEKERKILSDYTRNAIDFASVIGCKNLVFGCPKNRNKPENADENVSIDFFKSLGDYAFSKNTCIAMEANPAIYNTNYINTTEAALDLIKKVDSDGFKLNLDVGTMIQNQESIDVLKGKTNLINHVHISEPFLKKIEKKELHVKLVEFLRQVKYSGFVSVEMGLTENLSDLEDVMRYLREI